MILPRDHGVRSADRLPRQTVVSDVCPAAAAPRAGHRTHKPLHLGAAVDLRFEEVARVVCVALQDAGCTAAVERAASYPSKVSSAQTCCLSYCRSTRLRMRRQFR